ncbi:uncharacterized protein C8A04DRAFT_36333 [Dichotomopilus funicola]|uniref:Uncharacterized protein n=1 Tax=Dichotomopilus funicola TaxID=1934379 RepID=A0AAN6V4S3_9PEZI|nr:hypothetical protein C8A04DRAFT_36333 [Dichotomopilus funicola]
MARTYRILHRPWKARAPLFWGMLPELGGIIPLLVMFAFQQPDGFRTLFWRIGFENKLNSNPNMILYAYANYQPLPTIPFVWSRMLTDYNVAISVLSLFVLLAKMIGIIMKVFYPVIGTFVGVCMTVLYAVSVYGQAGPDYADSRYPSPVPWHLRSQYGCKLAERYGAGQTCQMVQATLGVTAYMLVLYLCQTGFAVWAMIPNKELDMYDSDDEDNDYRKPAARDKGVTVQMQPTPPNEQMPFTPRTQAFHTLERKLPLRA